MSKTEGSQARPIRGTDGFPPAGKRGSSESTPLPDKAEVRQVLRKLISSVFPRSYDDSQAERSAWAQRGAGGWHGTCLR